MCGRYAIEFEDEAGVFGEIIKEINHKYSHTEALAKMKSGEIFPTDTVPAIASETAQPFLMNWGIPRWDKKGVIINARAETAMEKKLFRSSLLTRRCILPSTGFYEWARKDASLTLFDFQNASSPAVSESVPGGKAVQKGKYLLSIPDKPILYMAGFYNTEAASADTAPPSFVILTTAANEWVSPLHHRMPLILHENDVAAWLSDSQKAACLLARPCETQLDVRPA